MIVYLDTAAIVPVVIEEPTTAVCRRIWDDADRRVSSRLAYVEVAAALAMAERRERLSAAEYDTAWTTFTEIWPDVDVIDVTSLVLSSAGAFARSLALRGYDAVHCASAAAVSDPDLVSVSGDSGLLGAWRRLGMAVLDTNQAEPRAVDHDSAPPRDVAPSAGAERHRPPPLPGRTDHGRHAPDE